jgi:hypothetical protein
MNKKVPACRPWQAIRSFPRLTPPTFCQPWSLLRKAQGWQNFLIVAQATSKQPERLPPPWRRKGSCPGKANSAGVRLAKTALRFWFAQGIEAEIPQTLPKVKSRN